MRIYYVYKLSSITYPFGKLLFLLFILIQIPVTGLQSEDIRLRYVTMCKILTNSNLPYFEICFTERIMF